MQYSFYKNNFFRMINFFLFVLGISLWSTWAVLMKHWAMMLPKFELSLTYFLNIFLNKYIAMSFILYFIPALIWLYLLTKYPVSFVQPILALTYVITPILAFLFLWENIPMLRVVWIIIIILWVYLVSRT